MAQCGSLLVKGQFILSHVHMMAKLGYRLSQTFLLAAMVFPGMERYGSLLV